MPAVPAVPAAPDHPETAALRKALLIGAGLLLAWVLPTAALDALDLLATERYRMDARAALQLVLALRDAPAAPQYMRLYVLAGCALANAAAAVALLALALGLGRQAPDPRRTWVAVAGLGLVLVLVSLPAHLPFLGPPDPADAAPGTRPASSEASRAYRDAITYVWSAALLVAIPVAASGRFEVRVKVAGALLAQAVVLSAYLPHLAHRGSRTDNELIIFSFCLAAVLYLSLRMQRAWRDEEQARALAEQALRSAESERQRYEEQSQAAIGEFRALQQRLQAREARRALFLASAAHDLRQPLTASLLYVDLLGQAMKASPAWAADGDAQKFLRVCKAEVGALAAAFDTILDYTQIESGKLAVNAQPHRLRDVFADLERRFTPMAAERRLQLQVRPPPPGCQVRTDKVLLTRLLSNLLSNAVKFSAPAHGARRRGDVVLRTRVRGLMATVYVMDRGCGIPPAMQEAVFEAGVQVDNAQRNRRDGFGLGLATVRGIVDRALPDHAVRLVSVEGRGTHMMVDVPLDFAPLADAPDEDPGTVVLNVQLAGALIAVVEDDGSLREGLAEVLQRAGAYVLQAGSQAAMERLLQAADRFPDILLTDHRLPDGANARTVIEAVRRCCAGRDIPAIVLTAEHLPAMLALKSLPLVEVLRKPLDRKALLRRLAAHYQPAASPLDGLA